MKKVILVLAAGLYLFAFGMVNAYAKKSLFYIIPKGTQVLAFLGDPHSLDFKPVRLTSAEDQTVLIFHRRSGRGIWAFYVRGFSHLDPRVGATLISDNGYFVISKYKIRSTGWR